MYPWVLLTVVQLTKKQQPTFEILLSQIEFFLKQIMKHSCKTRKVICALMVCVVCVAT